MKAKLPLFFLWYNYRVTSEQISWEIITLKEG
ncbi:hypothetical protein CDSM653_01432 [Caldanaerobacter subterraneus subsp. pacificus DSM 12653]|uniref:Uncharacterized protein n=1 Tax=Caldanaerobacter subterraneus subsp. pacificus DSM 12653 TaxID=391606 RepID=A0A0F5PM36_9THEO|nr:hypothetical protein CDSM653_01432 [Caldanaerobacter subterraneus subsp. pacificus DSM 12653]